MKQAIKYLCGVSLLALVLTACGKKEQEQEAPKTQAEEVATPEATPRPPMVCKDDIALKNRMVNLIQDQMLSASLDALGNSGNIAELERQLKARLAEITIDIQNPQVKDGECLAELHITLPEKDVSFADKAFVQAGMADLAHQAASNNITLLGTNRLVSQLVYHVDGEALSIGKTSPAVNLASSALAKSAAAITQQNKATAKKETAAVPSSRPNITPPPTVNLRPVERPRQQTPEEAILRPEDVPSGRPRRAETAESQPAQVQEDSPRTESRAERSEPSQSRSQTQRPREEAEPRPAPTPAPAGPSDEAKFTIVENNDETY